MLVTAQFYNLFGELAALSSGAETGRASLMSLLEASHAATSKLHVAGINPTSKLGRELVHQSTANAPCLPSPLAELASTEEHALLSRFVSIPQLASVCIPIVQIHFPPMEGLTEVCALDCTSFTCCLGAEARFLHYGA